MKRISIFLGEPQVAAFQALANERGRPYAELIREALDVFLRQRGRTVKPKADRKRAQTRKRP